LRTSRAVGKVLLAWRDRRRDSVLAIPLERRSECTVTDPLLLRRRSAANRRRQFATVLRWTPRRPATSPLVNPSPIANTIRDRCANALDVV
jgi:hypothetical protein